MGFDVRAFLETLLYIIDSEYVTESERLLDLEEFILDQVEYARDCKVID